MKKSYSKVWQYICLVSALGRQRPADFYKFEDRGKHNEFQSNQGDIVRPSQKEKKNHKVIVSLHLYSK